MANIELLQRTLDHIEANPQEWDQRQWAARKSKAGHMECGTAFCFAGWAVQLAKPGIKFNWQNVPIHPPFTGSSTVMRVRSEAHEIETDGNLFDIGSLATIELGINVGEADELFAEHNTIEHLRELVRKLIAGENIVPNYDDCEDCGGCNDCER